jgi:hypothetical protein
MEKDHHENTVTSILTIHQMSHFWFESINSYSLWGGDLCHHYYIVLRSGGGARYILEFGNDGLSMSRFEDRTKVTDENGVKTTREVKVYLLGLSDRAKKSEKKYKHPNQVTRTGREIAEYLNANWVNAGYYLVKNNCRDFVNHFTRWWGKGCAENE